VEKKSKQTSVFGGAKQRSVFYWWKRLGREIGKKPPFFMKSRQLHRKHNLVKRKVTAKQDIGVEA